MKVKPDKIVILIGILSWSVLSITIIYFGLSLINNQMIYTFDSYSDILLALMLFDILSIILSFIAIFIAIIGRGKIESKKRFFISLIINFFYIFTALVLLKIVVWAIGESLMGV